MSYRDEYLEKFDVLERALSEDLVPEGFEALGDQLREKLSAEKSNYLSQFSVDDPDRITAPCMGILELISEKTEAAEWFFGSDLRSRNRIRIRLSHASVNTKTQEVFKEGLISDIILSEKQFADVILNLDWGHGFPVTQLTRLGVDLEPVTREDDPTRHNFDITLDGVRTTGFVDEAIKELREAIKVGKIPKRDADNLAKDLYSSVSLLPDNAAHAMDRITEEYSKRVAEASLILHLDARTSGIPTIEEGR